MKTLLGLLYDTKDKLEFAMDSVRECEFALNVISETIEYLQTPCWYTPKQWEEKTGKPWPDNGAVYMLWQPPESRGSPPFWRIENYAYVKLYLKDVIAYGENCLAVICATEAGPPPDDWEPEGVARGMQAGD
jgi:hypothetical protein